MLQKNWSWITQTPIFSKLLALCDLRFRAWLHKQVITEWARAWLYFVSLSVGKCLFLPMTGCEVDQNSCHVLISWLAVMPVHSCSQPSWCGPWSVHQVFSCLRPCPWKCTGIVVALPSKVTQTQLEIFFCHLKLLIFSTFLLLCGVTYFPDFQHCKLSLMKHTNLELIWEIRRKILNCVIASSRGPCAHCSVM